MAKQVYAIWKDLTANKVGECDWIYGSGLTGQHGSGKRYQNGRHTCTECRPQLISFTTFSDLSWVKPTDVVITYGNSLTVVKE